MTLADLKYYSEFSLARVFSWQYKFEKKEHPNRLPILQRNFYVKWWVNPAQQNYSTVKKEILAIVLCVSKFQSDLLNQNFLICVDCKSAKHILQKDVKNLTSKQIFAR